MGGGDLREPAAAVCSFDSELNACATCQGAVIIWATVQWTVAFRLTVCSPRKRLVWSEWVQTLRQDWIWTKLRRANVRLLCDLSRRARTHPPAAAALLLLLPCSPERG